MHRVEAGVYGDLRRGWYAEDRRRTAAHGRFDDALEYGSPGGHGGLADSEAYVIDAFDRHNGAGEYFYGRFCHIPLMPGFGAGQAEDLCVVYGLCVFYAEGEVLAGHHVFGAVYYLLCHEGFDALAGPGIVFDIDVDAEDLADFAACQLPVAAVVENSQFGSWRGGSVQVVCFYHGGCEDLLIFVGVRALHHVAVFYGEAVGKEDVFVADGAADDDDSVFCRGLVVAVGDAVGYGVDAVFIGVHLSCVADV